MPDSTLEMKNKHDRIAAFELPTRQA